MAGLPRNGGWFPSESTAGSQRNQGLLCVGTRSDQRLAARSSRMARRRPRSAPAPPAAGGAVGMDQHHAALHGRASPGETAGPTVRGCLPRSFVPYANTRSQRRRPRRRGVMIRATLNRVEQGAARRPGSPRPLRHRDRVPLSVPGTARPRGHARRAGGALVQEHPDAAPRHAEENDAGMDQRRFHDRQARRPGLHPAQFKLPNHVFANAGRSSEPFLAPAQQRPGGSALHSVHPEFSLHLELLVALVFAPRR